MLCPPLSSAPLIDHWIERHRHLPSLLLHLVGIPVSVLGVLLIPVYLPLLSWRMMLFSLGLFLGGYGLQFLGHLLEWTEPGEITAIRARWSRRRSSPPTTGAEPPT